MSSILETAMMIAFGAVEGYALAWSGIPCPQFFRDQMTFRSFGIMKFFLGAVGSSMVAQSLMSLTHSKQFDTSRFYTYLSVPYSRSVPGCFLLGVGMYIAASGPTMIGAQLWMGVSATPYVIAGALAGGTVFGMLEPALPLPQLKNVKKVSDTSVDGKLGTSYASVAMPLGLAMMGAAQTFEHFFPHAEDISRMGVPSLNLPPLIGAVVVGLNQIPIRLITQDGQGGSTCIMNAVSTATMGLISPRHQMKKLSDSHQLMYVYLGMGMGASLLCHQVSSFSTPPDFGASAGFVGAFIATLGARYAAGCTCGHGVSGVSELSLSSWAAAASIFSGGIVAGVVHSNMQ